MVQTEETLHQEPTRKRRPSKGKPTKDSHGQAVRFLMNVINATIHASGDDYPGAVHEFFPQLQALGHLIGARSLDEVSQFLRSRASW